MGRALVAFLIAAVSIALQTTLTAAFPQPAGPVTDFADVLSENARAEALAIIRGVEQKTSAEIAIATVTSLDGMSVDEYANTLFHEWGIGQADRDNGVLILIATAERKIRIEVGYGLEPILPDGLAGEIIREEIAPWLRTGEYSTGVLAGVRRVAAIVEANHTVTDEERARYAANAARFPTWLTTSFFGFFVVFGAFALGTHVRSRDSLGIVVGLAFAGIPYLVSRLEVFNVASLWLEALALLVAIVGFVNGERVAAPAVSTAGKTRRRRKRGPSGEKWAPSHASASSAAIPPSWSSSASSSWSSSTDSSDSSSSSDSFGGGDSGGGGASGDY